MSSIDFFADVEALASSVPDSADCYFVPAFSGLYAVRDGLNANILYTVRRPVIRKKKEIRIWVVPPACLGSR